MMLGIFMVFFSVLFQVFLGFSSGFCCFLVSIYFLQPPYTLGNDLYVTVVFLGKAVFFGFLVKQQKTYGLG